MCRQDFNAQDKMKCPNDGNESSTCFLTRRNCVTCRIKANGDVFIRYQSNGIPSHCYGSSYDDKSGYPEDQNIDFEVKWNTDVSTQKNYPQEFDEKQLVDKLLCDYTRLKEENMFSDYFYFTRG